MKTICATVAGRVIECLRGNGDHVQPGDEVLKIESMKMEIPVESEVAGRITMVLVEAGEVVQEGQVLVQLG